jgi:hypothetical protein
MAIAVLVAMTVFAAALAGWGTVVARYAGLSRTCWLLTIAWGLAAVLFLGGVLNALHLAFAAALATIVIGGLCLLGLELRHTRRADLARFWKERKAKDFAVAGLIAAILIFTAVTQLPPSAFSFMDDFGKYFFHPLAMLANGSVLGGPTSDLGSETLGGKAFLDAFVVAIFPITAINATDAVFGLALALALAAVAARHAPA